MPCDFCNTNYNFKPCEYIEEEHYSFFEPVKPNRFHSYDFYKTFVLLQQACPCLNCLVKVTCTTKGYCPEYMDTIIRKVEK